VLLDVGEPCADVCKSPSQQLPEKWRA
jgi:hypothetical protein